MRDACWRRRTGLNSAPQTKADRAWSGKSLKPPTWYRPRFMQPATKDMPRDPVDMANSAKHLDLQVCRRGIPPGALNASPACLPHEQGDWLVRSSDPCTDAVGLK